MEFSLISIAKHTFPNLNLPIIIQFNFEIQHRLILTIITLKMRNRNDNWNKKDSVELTDSRTSVELARMKEKERRVDNRRGDRNRESRER